MGIGKWNARLIIKNYVGSDDQAGGELQLYGDQVIETPYVDEPVTEIWCNIKPRSAQRVFKDAAMVNQIMWEVTIRATRGFRPEKMMLLNIDDGYRSFDAVIQSILNPDVRRKFWVFEALEVQ